MTTDRNGWSRPLKGRLRNSSYAWQPSWLHDPAAGDRNKAQLVHESDDLGPSWFALLQAAS